MSNELDRLPEDQDFEIPDEIPLLPIRDLVVFPFMIVPLVVTRDISSAAIEETLAHSSDRLVFLVTQRQASIDHPRPEDLHKVGCVGMIMRMARMKDGRVKVLVQGLLKASIRRVIRTDPCFRVVPERRDDLAWDAEASTRVEGEAMMREAKQSLERYISLGKSIPQEVALVIEAIEDPGRLADLIASHLSLKVDRAQHLMDTFDPVERLREVNRVLENEVEVLSVQQRIQDQARQEMSRTQREYFLREQLRAIQTELGDDDAHHEELEGLRGRVARAGMPPQVVKEAERHLRRLRHMPGESSESAVLRNYLDWLVELPWTQQTEDTLDLDHAQRVLDNDHFGLDRIKERVLEHLAVRKLKQDMRGPILCFVGPPGVGKTSLGRSIARAMGREFTQVSLGGLRDEAEIRGHRRTYVGSMPGRIIHGLRQAGSRNPVFMLDEIDKVGSDFRGDPSSALLEVLDPAQNNRFNDLYLGVPFDLSNVLFIATANVVDTIPSPLRDRMEVISLPGYAEEEKLEIARRFILPRALEAHGLTSAHVHISRDAQRRLIRDYTREAGLRNLERSIAAICRKVARRVAGGKKTRTIVGPRRLPKLLGPPRPSPQMLHREDEIGVVTGLAWTQAGGEVLSIEATHMKGHAALKLTGHLGEVMKESAHTALSFLRAGAETYGIDADFFAEREIHVHVPAGAIPKDGPSAGVTIATALASVALQRPTRPDVAMTGEITLRGHILPVGGLKEKILAAVRAGVKTVLVPAANEVDLVDLPASLRRRVKIVTCGHVDAVFREALVARPGALKTDFPRVWPSTSHAPEAGLV